MISIKHLDYVHNQFAHGDPALEENLAELVLSFTYRCLIPYAEILNLKFDMHHPILNLNH
jgi:hypothetical protein